MSLSQVYHMERTRDQSISKKIPKKCCKQKQLLENCSRAGWTYKRKENVIVKCIFSTQSACDSVKTDNECVFISMVFYSCDLGIDKYYSLSHESWSWVSIIIANSTCFEKKCMQRSAPYGAECIQTHEIFNETHLNDFRVCFDQKWMFKKM